MFFVNAKSGLVGEFIDVVRDDAAMVYIRHLCGWVITANIVFWAIALSMAR